MLCLRLKLLQITNLHICIKLGNGHSIKTIHTDLVITLKIPFRNSCITRNNHTLYIPLQNNTFSVPILKPSYYLSDAFICWTIILTVNNIIAENLLVCIYTIFSGLLILPVHPRLLAHSLISAFSSGSSPFMIL